MDEISRLLFDSISVEYQALARNIKTEVINHKYTVNRNPAIEQQLIREKKTTQLSPFEIEKEKIQRGGVGTFKFRKLPTMFDAREMVYTLRIAKTSTHIADCQVIRQVVNSNPELLSTISIGYSINTTKKHLKEILVQFDPELIISIDNLKSIA